MDASDGDLLERFISQDDEGAFGILVRRHLNLVHAVARRMVGSDDLAKDVTQNTFIRLAQCAKSIPPQLSLVAWLHRTTRSKAIDLVRAESRRKKIETSALPSLFADRAGETEWAAMESVLDDLVNRLRMQDREVLILRYFQNQTHAAVGRALGVSEQVARKRANRALEGLRILMKRRGMTTTAATLAMLLPARGAGSAPAGMEATVMRGLRAAWCPPATGFGSKFFLMMSTSQKIAAAVLVLICLWGTTGAVAHFQTREKTKTASNGAGPVLPGGAGSKASPRMTDVQLQAALRGWMTLPGDGVDPDGLGREVIDAVQHLSPKALEQLMNERELLSNPIAGKHVFPSGSYCYTRHFEYRSWILDLLWKRYGTIAPDRALALAFGDGEEELPVGSCMVELVEGVSKTNAPMAYEAWQRYCNAGLRMAEEIQKAATLDSVDALRAIGENWAKQDIEGLRKELLLISTDIRPAAYEGYIASLDAGTDWIDELRIERTLFPRGEGISSLVKRWAKVSPADSPFHFGEEPYDNRKVLPVVERLLSDSKPPQDSERTHSGTTK